MHKTLSAIAPQAAVTDNQNKQNESIVKRVHFEQQQSKNYYKNHHVKLHNIKVGDKVCTKVQVKSHKLQPDWSESQEVIVVYNNNLTIRLLNGKVRNVQDSLLYKHNIQ